MWTNIKWKLLEYDVLKMQNRIAEAYKLKDIKLVAKQQLILVSSFAARALAVRKVTTNQGSKTPGIDGMTWTSDVDKWSAIGLLKKATPSSYRASPVRRVMIPKPGSLVSSDLSEFLQSWTELFKACMRWRFRPLLSWRQTLRHSDWDQDSVRETH